MKKNKMKPKIKMDFPFTQKVMDIIAARAHLFRYREKMDGGLEPFLSFLALELELHAPIETALHRAAEHAPAPLREELRATLHHSHEKGMGVETALATWAQKWNHPPLTRAVTLIVHVARQGATETSIQGLRRLAEDLRIQQQTRLKRFASALTLYALIFIGVSAVVPALFLAFLTIGSRFLELSFTPADVLAIALLGFPVVDALILGLVWLQTPVELRASENQNEKRNATAKTKNIRLPAWNSLFYSTPEGQQLLRTSVIEGASLFLIGWCVYLGAHMSGIGPLIVVGGSAIGPFIANALWREFAFERETARMERILPDSLVLLAALPVSLSFERRLDEITRTTPVPLQGEWSRVQARIEKGDSIPDSLQGLGENRESRAFQKTRHLLARAYESGWPLAAPASALAHELLVTQSLVEERRAVLLVEKYTLLAAGGLLVPLLLGIMLGVMDQLPAPADSSLGLGSSSGEITEIIPFAVRGYLLFYAALAGIFVGLLDGQRVRGLGYAALLIPLSQLVLLAGEWVMRH